MNFYACIIGTELLNGRRKDSHFEFLNSELLKRGHELKASFVIKDDPQFIADVFELIKKDKNSVMFCFGGIGATPDDYTREVAARVFTGGEMEDVQSVIDIIVARMGERAYPDRVKMAHLPKNAGLLSNPINQIPGFYLEDRFFFLPGFPQMAQPMVVEALDRFYKVGALKFKKTFTAFCSEGDIVDIMNTLPPSVEFSSLPIMDGDKRAVEIYLASPNSCVVEDVFEHFVTLTEKKGYRWREGGYFDA
ncbi:MAG: molybdopterin-binding protein [Campylobacterales bacterium]|nr:molybdopterin-binding protein [Campylobacterales bacterium]